jgi:HD-like signal output (HDOD) protein
MNVAVAVLPASATDTALGSNNADHIIKEIGVPPCPAVLADFMAESNRDEPDFRRLSHLVNKDVGLAGSVLKTVNSPFYGLRKKAGTVHEALTLLGLRELSRLIAGLLLRQAFASCSLPAMEEYWDGSSRIAMASAYLARELGVSRLEEAHTFSLFRDCGLPVLLMRFPDYAQLLEETRTESEFRRAQIERARYGYDHAMVGAALAQSWYMPSEVWRAIWAHNGFHNCEFLSDPQHKRQAPVIALGLLAEKLYRVHRGTFEPQAWTAEEAFVTEVIGPMGDRLDDLASDLERIIGGT